jgi:hypothetical protein
MRQMEHPPSTAHAATSCTNRVSQGRPSSKAGDRAAAELRKKLDAFIGAGRSLDRKLGLVVAEPTESECPSPSSPAGLGLGFVFAELRQPFSGTLISRRHSTHTRPGRKKARRGGPSHEDAYFGSKKSAWTTVPPTLSVACSVASIHIDAPARTSRSAARPKGR